MEFIKMKVMPMAATGGGMPPGTKYATALELTIDPSTFVITGQLVDQNGDPLGTAQTIDLPFESIIVNGSYDSATQSLILTLQNGNTITIPVSDLVSGLQETLVSGENIKSLTVNGIENSLLGSGTITLPITATEITLEES